MDRVLNESDDLFDHADYYLSQSRAFVLLYLADHHLTIDMLEAMPEEQVNEIRKEALAFASQQIARIEAIIRLGQRDVDTKQEPSSKGRHIDRLSRRFLLNFK